MGGTRNIGPIGTILELDLCPIEKLMCAKFYSPSIIFSSGKVRTDRRTVLRIANLAGKKS